MGNFLLTPFTEVLRSTRDVNYRYYGRGAIFYPPSGVNDCVYVVSSIYLSPPLLFNQLDSRIIGGETHLSIRLSEVNNFRKFDSWQVVLMNNEQKIVKGKVDAVIVDDTQGVLNIKYNLIDDQQQKTEPTAQRRSYQP